MPTASEGFNHVGDEVWYHDEKDPAIYKICKTEAGEAENSECSNSYNLFYEHAAHLAYLGVNLGEQCTTPVSVKRGSFL
jgi:hypothetical protein